MRSSHIVSESAARSPRSAMNNENSPAGGNCGRSEKEGEGRALSLDRKHAAGRVAGKDLFIRGPRKDVRSLAAPFGVSSARVQDRRRREEG